MAPRSGLTRMGAVPASQAEVDLGKHLIGACGVPVEERPLCSTEQVVGGLEFSSLEVGSLPLGQLQVSFGSISPLWLPGSRLLAPPG